MFFSIYRKDELSRVGILYVMCPCLYLYIIYTLVEKAFDHEFCVMQTMSACTCL